jgi:hypothetical protein
MTKTLKDMTSEIAKLKWESKQPNKTFQGGGNTNQNQFRRPNDAPPIMQRERRNVDDQRVVPPFQNNQIEEMDEDIDVVDDTVVLFNETYYYIIHLTQQEYEVAQLSNQFDDQIVEEGVIQRQPKNKYDLRMRGVVGQLRGGGVNQLLPCLNNYASFKLFAETLNDVHNNAGK